VDFYLQGVPEPESGTAVPGLDAASVICVAYLLMVLDNSSGNNPSQLWI
jgi:hypothetical protein